MVRGGRGEAVPTRYEVGDGEDGDGPPHGARLGLLHQIVHALHPLPHLGLRGGARGGGGSRGRARSGRALPPRIHRRRRRTGQGWWLGELNGDF
jgi:hypothetical protein